MLSLADVVDPAGDNRARARRSRSGWSTTLLDALPPLVQPDQWTGGDGVRIAVAAGARRPAVGADAPTLKWEGLDYRVDCFAAEHARLKRIREQIESPGLDAALAADDDATDRRRVAGADLHAGARRSRRPGAARRRHRAASQLRPRRRRRHAPRLRWRGRCRASRSATAAPWHIEGSILGLDIALARLALRRIERRRDAGRRRRSISTIS